MSNKNLIFAKKNALYERVMKNRRMFKSFRTCQKQT